MSNGVVLKDRDFTYQIVKTVRGREKTFPHSFRYQAYRVTNHTVGIVNVTSSAALFPARSTTFAFVIVSVSP